MPSRRSVSYSSTPAVTTPMTPPTSPVSSTVPELTANTRRRPAMKLTKADGITAAPSRISAGTRWGLPVSTMPRRMSSNSTPPTTRTASHDQRRACPMRTLSTVLAPGPAHPAGPDATWSRGTGPLPRLLVPPCNGQGADDSAGQGRLRHLRAEQREPPGRRRTQPVQHHPARAQVADRGEPLGPTVHPQHEAVPVDVHRGARPGPDVVQPGGDRPADSSGLLGAAERLLGRQPVGDQLQQQAADRRLGDAAQAAVGGPPAVRTGAAATPGDGAHPARARGVGRCARRGYWTDAHVLP